MSLTDVGRVSGGAGGFPERIEVREDILFFPSFCKCCVAVSTDQLGDIELCLNMTASSWNLIETNLEYWLLPKKNPYILSTRART